MSRRKFLLCSVFLAGMVLTVYLQEGNRFVFSWRLSIKDLPQSPKPVWLLNQPPLQHGLGELRDTNDPSFAAWHSIKEAHASEWGEDAWDSEPYIAVRKFFWGQEHGLVLEMGALDGWVYSASRPFLKLGWHRILAEGSPRFWSPALERSPDATYVGAAICKGDVVHYLQAPKTPAINGIAEFMTADFMKTMHPKIYGKVKAAGGVAKVQWKDLIRNNTRRKRSMVLEVPCVTLQSVLGYLGVEHVNFFILDVEGGELSILESIDFQQIMFDVIAVETTEEGGSRSPGTRQKVKELLETKGYTFQFDFGRNSWFCRKDFSPFQRRSWCRICWFARRNKLLVGYLIVFSLLVIIGSLCFKGKS